ncbi:uncharacterized protein N7482_007714 [Penicillium canariense]|uniref:Uncharacterized protein n=1 Tax=Penicillium canariense TaxID=189055 RepID=A0A9W9I027_9EURO|nr:uncharacterized protein N7482_007714 [Penicillium canariense]KAJ5160710.1 hypothetical protein N7482_007714 [Penicillium canariense]
MVIGWMISKIPLRRDNPATHTVFGPALTINFANYMLIDVIDEARNLDDPQCMTILVDELRNLFIGQSFGLHWTRQGECPSEEEYLGMVTQKRGGVFVLHISLEFLAMRLKILLRAISADFMSLIGRYFQIRDDYMNLMDTKVGTSASFAETPMCFDID